MGKAARLELGAKGKRGGRVRGGEPRRSDSSKMEGLSSPEKASKKGLEMEKLEEEEWN